MQGRSQRFENTEVKHEGACPPPLISICGVHLECTNWTTYTCHPKKIYMYIRSFSFSLANILNRVIFCVYAVTSCSISTVESYRYVRFCTAHKLKHGYCAWIFITIPSNIAFIVAGKAPSSGQDTHNLWAIPPNGYHLLVVTLSN